MKTFSRPVLLLALAALTLAPIALVSTSFAAKPTPLPPVRYQIQFWSVPVAGNTSIWAVNNHAQVVGQYSDSDGELRGFVYDPAIDIGAAVDLETYIGGAGVPAGWRIARARGINDHGVIVGNLVPIGQTGSTPYSMGFVLDMSAPTPTVVTLPNWFNSPYSLAIDINEDGDILGRYQTDGSFAIYFYNPNNPATPLSLASSSGDGAFHLNNSFNGRPAQVAGWAANQWFRWTPETGVLEAIPASLDIRGLNDAGTVCGASSSTSKNGTAVSYPYRMTTPPAQVLSGAGQGAALSINFSADVRERLTKYTFAIVTADEHRPLNGSSPAIG